MRGAKSYFQNDDDLLLFAENNLDSSLYSYWTMVSGVRSIDGVGVGFRFGIGVWSSSTNWTIIFMPEYNDLDESVGQPLLV